MSLFKKKKKEDPNFEKTLPSLEPKTRGFSPNIPLLPEEKVGFPSYDKELSSIKQEVEKVNPIPKLDAKLSIPQRPPMMRPAPPQLRPLNPRVNVPPVVPSSRTKPVFVKIENYQGALTHMNNLRELVRQGEEVLSELTQIRADEERQLNKWYQDIERVKEKLLSIDKKLFES